MRDHHPMLHELMDQVISYLNEDSELRDELISTLGQAWTSNLDHEDQDDDRLALDNNTLESIVEDARYLILEGLAEGGKN